MLKKLIISSLIFMSFFIWLSNPAGAATRTALVIGNSNYESAPLKNPVNDAEDMEKALKSLGFEVIKKINADRRAMIDALDEFAGQLRDAEIGLFYFAGHGMQIQGSNYLIPVKAHVTSESDVRFESMDAGRVLGKMQDAGNKFNIVILDACRDNPFKRSFRTGNKGLAQMDAPIGTIIAYATGPGSVAADGDGRNGIYTKHLLSKLKTSGLEVQDIFRETGLGVMKDTGNKQVPWISSTPVPRYYLASSGAGVYGGSDSGKTLLTVEGNPKGAKVYIDNRYAGTMPLKDLEVSPGDRRLRVSRDGYDDYQKTVTVEKGRSVSMYIELSALRQAKARLYVDTEPGGADVRILNLSSGYYQGIELEAGRYNVEASASKYEKKEIWVDVAAGEDKRVSIRLEPVKAVDRTFTNSFGMKFVLIPAGSFMMGSPSNEKDRDKDETQHRVTLTRDYYMQTTEVTQGQWKAVMGNYPSKFSYCGDNCPVEQVSWNECQEFIRKLNQREGTDKYRLPTEAEWEYAARAGAETRFCFGDDEAMLGQYAWYGGNSGSSTHPVAGKQPNAWGLYDMHGNVYEWCEDWYGDYPSGSVTDPAGSSTGSYRVIRGGSWHGTPRYVRCALRDSYYPVSRDGYLGFRLMRTN